MAGIIGKKIGMTQLFDEAGNLVAVTVIEAGPCPVTSVRTLVTGHGPASMTVTATRLPASSKSCVMPIFLPIMPAMTPTA